jgi:asparagine synthase (glutamine-hydrolysing)
MKRVFLQNNYGFSWSSSANCFVKGYLIDKNDNFYRDERLLEYFEEVDSFADFEERVKYANGCFAVVFRKDDDLFLASDKIRSIPLFYCRFEGRWIVSDNPYYLVEKTGLSEKNSIASIEFIATGYVTGDETLVEGIRQVQAGEIINLKKDDHYSRFYYSFRVNDTIDEEYDVMRKAGINVFEKAFSRLVKSLEGKTAVIPLSGGYDSRLIAVMLKKAGYEKVICFTYGRRSNPEIPVSEEVARRLGFKWYYIEYHDDRIKDYMKNKDFKDYYRFASSLVSMFFMQEYFAVKYLKDNGVIPEDSVFIPGHSGDFLGGSQLNKHGNLNLKEDDDAIVDRIYDVKYCYKKPSKDEAERVKERIVKSLKEKYSQENAFAYSIHEDWDFKEKLAKFNFNSITTYTYFGYEYRLPFWDADLLDFSKYLPLHAKINKFLYDDILTNQYFEKYDLNLGEELQLKETDIKKLKIKSRIKKYLPEDAKRLFVKTGDGIFYNEITAQLREDLDKQGFKIKIHGNSYNSLIIQWYHFQVEEYLKSLKS